MLLFSEYDHNHIVIVSSPYDSPIILQLLQILDDWTNNLDQGKQIDVMYTDFVKAFDKVLHHGLLCKRKEYHLDHQLHHCISDFFV